MEPLCLWFGQEGKVNKQGTKDVMDPQRKKEKKSTEELKHSEGNLGVLYYWLVKGWVAKLSNMHFLVWEVAVVLLQKKERGAQGWYVGDVGKCEGALKLQQLVYICITVLLFEYDIWYQSISRDWCINKWRIFIHNWKIR